MNRTVMMRMFRQRSRGQSAGSLALGPWHIPVRVTNVLAKSLRINDFKTAYDGLARRHSFGASSVNGQC